MSEIKGKIKKGANLVEGEVPFRDYNNSKDGKPTFETWDLDEWDQHCKEKGLKQSGSMKCALCPKIVEFTDLPYGEKPLCGTCLENVQKYSKHVTIKGEREKK